MPSFADSYHRRSVPAKPRSQSKSRTARATIWVVLENAPGSELERLRVPIRSNNEDRVSDAIIHTIDANWSLRPGDTIRVIEEGGGDA